MEPKKIRASTPVREQEAVFLQEIAAQLAELNKARKPRWVWLSFNGNLAPVNANEVRSVRFRSNTSTWIHWTHISECDSVNGPLEEVCAKLKIPMERPSQQK